MADSNASLNVFLEQPLQAVTETAEQFRQRVRNTAKESIARASADIALQRKEFEDRLLIWEDLMLQAEVRLDQAKVHARKVEATLAATAERLVEVTKRVEDLGLEIRRAGQREASLQATVEELRKEITTFKSGGAASNTGRQPSIRDIQRHGMLIRTARKSDLIGRNLEAEIIAELRPAGWVVDDEPDCSNVVRPVSLHGCDGPVVSLRATKSLIYARLSSRAIVGEHPRWHGRGITNEGWYYADPEIDRLDTDGKVRRFVERVRKEWPEGFDLSPSEWGSEAPENEFGMALVARAKERKFFDDRAERVAWSHQHRAGELAGSIEWCEQAGTTLAPKYKQIVVELSRALGKGSMKRGVLRLDAAGGLVLDGTHSVASWDARKSALYDALGKRVLHGLAVDKVVDEVVASVNRLER
jgi:hypothetical protein